jgi:hypothetical protein
MLSKKLEKNEVYHVKEYKDKDYDTGLAIVVIFIILPIALYELLS